MAKVERETVVDFEFPSAMKDVGIYRTKLLLKRRTATIVTDIKLAKARMLGGYRAANNYDDLHFDVMATLSNAIEPVPNPNPHNSTAWIEDVLDPAIWTAMYDRWLDYQDSFSAKDETKDETSAKAAG